MKRFLNVVVGAVSILGLLALGCGDDPADTGLSDSQILAAVHVEAQCEAAWECPETLASRSTPGFPVDRFSSKEECIDELTGIALSSGHFGLMGIDGERLEAAIAAGRISVDPSHFDRCRDEITNRWCEFDNPRSSLLADDACDDFVEGQLGEDDPCLDDWECNGNLRCDNNASEQCWGQCVPADSSTDNSDSSGLICGDERCDSDQYCSDDPEVCETRGAEGDECNPQHRNSCQDRYFCSSDDTCKAPVLREKNESCVEPEQFCKPGLTCYGDTSGLGGLGLTMRADTATGECGPLGQRGDACRFTADCKYGLFCIADDESTFDECRPPSDVGGPCSRHIHCDNSRCNGQECVEFLDIGAPCTSHTECASGNCLYEASQEEGECIPEDADICELPDGQ